MNLDASWPNSSCLSSQGQKNAPPRKLRDSCSSCASSKIKCTKEKPTCTRCSRRGLSCNYPASRRTGRTSASKMAAAAAAVAENTTSNGSGDNAVNESEKDSSSTSTNNNNNNTVNNTVNNMVNSTAKGIQVLTPGSSTDTVAGSSELMLTSPNIDVDVWHPVLTPSGTSFMADINDFFTSVLSNSMPEHGEDVLLSRPSTTQTTTSEANSLHGQAFSIGEISGLDSSTSSSSPLLQPQLTPRSCLKEALEMLTQLFANTTSACTQTSSESCGAGKIATIESVVAENKQIMDAMERLLKCPCSQDEYLLTIISLIIFKALAWYAAAAGNKKLTDHDILSSNPFAGIAHSYHQPLQVDMSPPPFLADSAFGMGNCIFGSTSSRAAAQTVLSELHRVQRLVNSLSERFETVRLRNSKNSQHGAVQSTPTTNMAGVDMAMTTAVSMTGPSPLSGPTFSQLEVDLRKRLRAVSSEIIDILRRE